MAEVPIRSRPRRAPRVRYPNDDSDSDEPSEPSNPNPRPSRTARRVQTYRESSDNETSDTSTEEADSEQESRPSDSQSQIIQRTSRVTRQSVAPPRKRKVAHTTSARVATVFRANKRQKIQPGKSTIKAARQVTLPVGAGSTSSTTAFIPPWKTLPYQVLVSIMQYAAYPLYGPQSDAQPSISWLCATGSLCRSFHDACLSALLHRPPLYPLHRARGLMRILKRERDRPGTLFTTYGPKIRYLDIEVKQLLKKNAFKLEDLISFTPQLQGLRLYSNYDDMTTVVWAQPSAKKIRWEYPLNLIKRLEHDNIILKSFEWNGRFPNVVNVLKEAMAAHSRPSFNLLQDVTFLNLSFPEKTDEVDLVSAGRSLGTALKVLSQLRSLAFRNCAMIDGATMPLLPRGLTRLEITNCLHLTSTILERYLSTAGTSLRSMKLNNNQSMDLGFMAKLQTLCPQLQSLEIDMVYIDPSSWQDRDPLFDELLPKGPPTWPSQLINISMENLRQLTEADAEKFLTSIVDAADDLPYLRKLNLKLILKEASWRDRAKLRQKWMPALESVFLNKDKPSTTFVTSPGPKTSRSALHRQSTRIAEGRFKEVSSSETSDESDGSAKGVRASCDVVELVISDQRPAETQYHEKDFLDTEPSDDDEYMD
ncbi:hypothetical protein H2200_010634 [Cladophialophora chaetospira]|uniref:Uncharacterized protein n=1 Tax=Cladophialophora chaetospira TaxID=386627 RepID=A0AA39CDQ4_9EURO|nr:hypothetical protein H2200_010634 [Cladophialophora chaetospira]